MNNMLKTLYIDLRSYRNLRKYLSFEECAAPRLLEFDEKNIVSPVSPPPGHNQTSRLALISISHELSRRQGIIDQGRN